MEGLLQTEVIRALGWTLVHAIWQVTAIALLLMLVLAVFRKSAPVIRYGAALGALTGIALLSAITFLVCLRMVQDGGAAQLTSEEMPLTIAAETAAAGFLPALTAFFYTHLTTLLGIWLTGVALLSLRFAGNMWFLNRLRMQAAPVSGEWAAKVTRMAVQYGIGRAVRLAESALVSAPVMIGHLKPLILVPAGMLAAIPHDQVEAILAHELAHIRRNDFLVNLLQSLAEIIYFFHPGVWWISSVIRRERELCCDDMATRQGCSPVTLAFALSEVGEWMHAGRNERLALAFSGKKEQPLLARVKRLLGQEPTGSLNIMPAGALVAVLVVVLLISGSGRVFSSSTEDEITLEPIVEAEVTSPGQNPDQSLHADQSLRDLTDTVPASKSGTVEIRRSSRESREQTAPDADRRERVPGGNGPGASGGGQSDTLPAPPVPPSPPALKSLPAPPDLSDLPAPPVPPAAVAPPAAPDMTPPPTPPAPPVPPVTDSVAWMQFGDSMKDFGTAVAGWVQGFVGGSDSTEKPEIQFNFDAGDMDDFEAAMENFGKKMEVWGETFGKKMEAWAQTNEPKLKEFERQMEAWSKENEPKFKEYERTMKEWEQDNKPRWEEYEQKMKAWEQDNKPRWEEYQRKMEDYQKQMQEYNKQMLEYHHKRQESLPERDKQESPSEDEETL